MKNSDLTARAERIANLMDQIDDLKVELKAAFEIAKSDGYKPKVLRKAIAVYRMDPKKRAKHDEDQADMFLMLDELEGKTERAAA